MAEQSCYELVPVLRKKTKDPGSCGPRLFSPGEVVGTPLLASGFTVVVIFLTRHSDAQNTGHRSVGCTREAAWRLLVFVSPAEVG